MCYSVSRTVNHRLFKVVAGMGVLSVPGKHSQSRSVHGLRIHEGFSPRTFNNDMALLRLASPWTFNDYVQPVCTPHSVSHELGLNLWPCFITGWGKMSFKGGCEDEVGSRPDSPMPRSSTCNAHVQRFL